MNRLRVARPRDRRRRNRARPGRARRAGRAARPGAARAQPVPRGQPAAEPDPGVRRAGRRPGPGRRGPHGARRPRGAFAARLLHPPRRPAHPHRVRDGAGARRAFLHHPPGAGDPARRGDLRAVRVVPAARRRAWSTPSRPRPTCPTPESLPDLGERVASGQRRRLAGQIPRPIDVRFVDEPVWASGRGASDAPMRVWMRADGRLPDDRLLHVCMLTYASDMTLLGSVIARHDLSMANVQMASLDHAMWFHRPFRADEWLLYTCYSPSATGSRGLATGRFTTRDGTAGGDGGAGGTGPARRRSESAESWMVRARSLRSVDATGRADHGAGARRWVHGGYECRRTALRRSRRGCRCRRGRGPEDRRGRALFVVDGAAAGGAGFGR